MKKIKRISVFFVFCVFVFSALLLSLDSSHIKFRDKKVDFGKVVQGEVLTTQFHFKNAGDSVLVIDKIKTSCGCTAALASKDKFQPGEDGDLKVTFKTRGYSGKVSKYIYVYSNNSNASRTVLTVTADIEVPPGPKIRLERTSADIGLILKGEEIQTETLIRNTGERELEVTFSHRNARFYQKGKELKRPLKIASGKQKEVNIHIQSPVQAGALREYILLKTNDPLRPNLSFYIRGYVVTEEQLKDLFDKYEHLIKRGS